MKSFDRLVIFIVAGMGLLLVIVVALGNQAGLPAPELALVKGQTGARGPLVVLFAEPVQLDSLEQRFSLDPPVTGRLSVLPRQGGRTEYPVAFWPEKPLEPGIQYALSLDAGVTSQTGLELRKPVSLPFSVRQPEVFFLSPTTSPELWQAAGDGSAPVQVTSTGGALFDFKVSADGSRIVYSAVNQSQGIDLWEMDRWTRETRLLLPCESDWCSSPVYSPDGTKIAYSRRRSGALPGEGPGVPRIWLLDLVQESTDLLYSDPNVGGYDPSWSPDGRFLAFFDGLAQGVRVLDLSQGTDFLLASQMGMVGEWSPDSRSLLFIDFLSFDAGPDVAVYEVDVETQQIRRALGEEVNQVDYSVPVWSPDGEILAVGVRLLLDGPGKQVWLMTSSGQQRRVITSDPRFTHASYHWDPTGNRLVFQRLEMGRSGTLPQIMVWDRHSEQAVMVAENAFLPAWAP
jgi:Tol biopolymer transport system component